MVEGFCFDEDALPVLTEEEAERRADEAALCEYIMDEIENALSLLEAGRLCRVQEYIESLLTEEEIKDLRE